ncbi:hypothetical protein SAMN04489731_101583 [Amycolatopsis regifaucium]|nr:hypothetical protein SAMN04489731_101583 [Amycolatopsis regifaucium]
MAPPAALEAPVFLADPEAQEVLADRRVPAAPVQEGLVGPAVLVARADLVGPVARAVLRPAAPARSPVLRPPRRCG